MKIAITSRFNYSFFSNGLNQNIVLLYEILESIGAEVCFLDFTFEENCEKFEAHEFINNKNLTNWKDFKKQKDQHIDILLCPGIAPNQDIYSTIKKANPKSKICAVHYGNNLMTDIHKLYFSEKPELYAFEETNFFDFCLYSPHYAFAKDYMSLSKECEALELPYIWDPKFIKKEAENVGADLRYKPVARQNIAVVEPCLNISKTNFIPLLTILQLLKEKPHIFNEAYIFSNKLGKDCIQPAKHLNTQTVLREYPKRVYFDPRQKIVNIFKNDNPIILAHQFYNELNYIYLEALYYDFPLVHNSPPFENAGYYYKEFNIREAVTRITEAAEKHNDTLDEQRESNRKIIDKYSLKANQSKTQKLIERIYVD